MHKLKYLTISIILVMSLSLSGPSFDVSARPLAAISPTLGAAASYSVLAGSIVTNTGAHHHAWRSGYQPKYRGTTALHRLSSGYRRSSGHDTRR